jgi:hypothetical protein
VAATTMELALDRTCGFIERIDPAPSQKDALEQSEKLPSNLRSRHRSSKTLISSGVILD